MTLIGGSIKNAIIYFIFCRQTKNKRVFELKVPLIKLNLHNM